MVNAVLDALRIVKESGSSYQTFEDILNYGKTLLLAGHNSGNIDREILLTLWPRNWNSVQNLLKEEEYKDAKLLFICICRNEKNKQEMEKLLRNMCTLENTASWRIGMTCAFTVKKKGYLKYYYLGISTKVKN